MKREKKANGERGTSGEAFSQLLMAQIVFVQTQVALNEVHHQYYLSPFRQTVPIDRAKPHLLSISLRISLGRLDAAIHSTTSLLCFGNAVDDCQRCIYIYICACRLFLASTRCRQSRQSASHPTRTSLAR